MADSFSSLCTEAFPIIQNSSYLNTASSGLLPKKVFNFRNEYNQAIFTDYSKIDYLEDEQVENVKEKIKLYFHAKEAEVAVLPNFSVGTNFIAEALPSNAKVVLLEGDYPSLNLPFERRNFQIAYAKINADLEQNILQQVERFQPDFLILSVVQFISGILIDFAFLKELKSNYPDLHIIGDATQYLGTEDFHFDDSAFSAIGASGYKWLHAGTGNAFYLLKNDFLEILEAKSVGSNSLLTKPNGPIRKVGFLEPGHFNMHAIKSLEVALDFHFKDVGIKRIEQEIRAIATQAKQALTDLHLLQTDVVLRKKHSAIFNVKGSEADLKMLLQNQIICAFRGQGIRIGFQYFNNQEDLEKILHYLRHKQ